MTDMKNIYTVRRDNLRAYMRDHGGATSTSKQLGHSNASTLSQLTGANSTRILGEKAARDYERKLALPVGWFDVPRTCLGAPILAPAEVDKPIDLLHASLLDHDRLKFCLETTQAAAEGVPLKNGKIMSIVVMAYDSPHVVGPELKRAIKQFVQLAL